MTLASATELCEPEAPISACLSASLALSNEAIDNVYIGALSNTNTSIPGGVIGTTQLADDSVTTAKILNGTIVNADINTSAAIDATKIHDGTISNTESSYKVFC